MNAEGSANAAQRVPGELFRWLVTLPVRWFCMAIFVVTLSAVDGQLCGAEPLLTPRTTLTNPALKYHVPEKPYVTLVRGPLSAVVVDNRAVDDDVLAGHRAGYHGIAQLKHTRQPRNLFVPAYSGLNLEHIHDGTNQPRDVLFEPRNAPMELRVINQHVAELYQPPTPHWGLESAMRYELFDDGVIEMTFECIPRRVDYRHGYIGLFWASYIDRPESGKIQFLGKPAAELRSAAQLQSTISPQHGEQATHRSVVDHRTMRHDEPFALPLPFGESAIRFTDPWYFGTSHGMAWGQIFRGVDQVRITQSPSGGGDGCPAWDFQWFIDNPQVGQAYQLVMRAHYAPLEQEAAYVERLRQLAQFRPLDSSEPSIEPRQATTRSDNLPPATSTDASAKPAGDDDQPIHGLAAKYPNDVGLSSDPAVLFADDFEKGKLEQWDEQRGTLQVTREQPHGGQWCVAAPMQLGENTGGDAIKWFMPGADTVYARCYVKFSANYQYNHHFLTLLANERANRWAAFGKAGLKPNGSYFSTGMEPVFGRGHNPSPGELNMYSYFIDMLPDPRMNKYWGNAFYPPGPGPGVPASRHARLPKLDTWQCWEFMVQANSQPELADGKQAMWLDGKLVGEFAGIRWRNNSALKVNCFWLQHYGYDEGDPTDDFWGREQTVWFDDVVIATEYIGPRTVGR